MGLHDHPASSVTAGNPVKMGNAGIKVSSAKRANSAHLTTIALEVIYPGKVNTVPTLATDTYKYFLHNQEIHRLKYTLKDQYLGLSRIKGKKYQSWL